MHIKRIRIHKTHQNAYKTYQNAYKTYQHAYKTYQNAYKTYQNAYKTYQKRDFRLKSDTYTSNGHFDIGKLHRISTRMQWTHCRGAKISLELCFHVFSYIFTYFYIFPYIFYIK